MGGLPHGVPAPKARAILRIITIGGMFRIRPRMACGGDALCGPQNAACALKLVSAVGRAMPGVG